MVTTPDAASAPHGPLTYHQKEKLVIYTAGFLAVVQGLTFGHVPPASQAYDDWFGPAFIDALNKLGHAGARDVLLKTCLRLTTLLRAAGAAEPPSNEVTR